MIRLAGYWEFPGGKVERDEDLATALRRELQEEIGVETEIGAEIHRVVHAYPDRDVRLYFFEATHSFRRTPADRGSRPPLGAPG